MGFADEFVKARGGRGGEDTPMPEASRSEPLTAAEGAAPDAKPLEGVKMPEHGDIFMDGLPAGLKPEEPKVEPTPEPKVETPPAADIKLPEEKPKPIKIGSREFATPEEALAYAQELDLASQKDQAYIEGLKEGQKKPEAEAPKKKTASEEFAEKVFEDPVKAAAEFQERLKAELREEYTNSIKAQTEAQRIEQHKRATWDNFYKQNPDLSSPETRDLLEGYLMKSFVDKGVLKATDSNEAFAREARKALRIQQEAAKPTQELPAGPVTTTGTAPQATPQATQAAPQESVDFVTQLKRMRTRQ